MPILIDKEQVQDIFPVTFKAIGPQHVELLLKGLHTPFPLFSLSDILNDHSGQIVIPPQSHDLATIEAHRYFAAQNKNQLTSVPAVQCINPTLSLIEVSWLGLAELFDAADFSHFTPIRGQEIILVFADPITKKIHIRPALPSELLALKIVVEDRNPKEIAEAENTTVATLDRAIEMAVAQGLIIKPASALTRDLDILDTKDNIPHEFLTAETFTLQWHITQACDLHCKHCYDRSQRQPVGLEEAKIVIAQLYDFCHEKHVHGQITFTGGNPLLHPNFFELYQMAADHGFMTAILGNPTTAESLNRIKAIQIPEFYQVSLEGLEKHNDYIRGQGHFSRVIAFLEILREAQIYSMVMLTLSRDNMEQVLPLAEILQDKVDLFTFNRLSAVGEAAQLLTPTKDEYQAFLHDFVQAEQTNPALANKDNIINLVRAKTGKSLFGGCAGFGCGAAFNFVSLLPDGEIHACRKFTSPIGNIHNQTLSDVYDSPKALSYRKGPSQCQGCRIRHVCGGCLAVIDSQGLDRTKDKDPCCFID